MKPFLNVLAVIQAIGMIAGIVISIVLSKNSMFDVLSLWTTNTISTLLSILIFSLSKNTFTKIAVINNTAIIVSVIANLIYGNITNYSYVISFFNMPDWFYLGILAICLIVNSVLIVFYARKQKSKKVSS